MNRLIGSDRVEERADLATFLELRGDDRGDEIDNEEVLDMLESEYESWKEWQDEFGDEDEEEEEDEEDEEDNIPQPVTY